ncbi:MAG: M23 family metallopeptidase [Abyssibacter sp.]|jgi:murein DD-endopeptidase MepM/ murein hydrolase activator NlpD|nr:M23 family metallopeptidase [Abyssibacter sp.]MCK5860639.1 M23 family metallopeptidase [Abyssibacter sp.]
MIRLAIALLIGTTLAAPAWAEPTLALRDDVTQGAMVRGATSAGAAVTMNGQSLPVSAEGAFVFAVARAFEGDVTLRATDVDGSTAELIVPVANREFEVQRIDGLPQDKVTPPRTQEVQDRIWQDVVQIRKGRGVESQRTDFTEAFLWPVDGIVTGVFGSQRILNGTPKSPHSGLDIAGDTGTSVLAPAGGVVTLWHPDMYFTGGTLIVDHGHGITSTFIHLSDTLVAEGDVVTQGQAIAKVGATGRATGPHLHWSMNWGKVRIDPQLLLPERNATK